MVLYKIHKSNFVAECNNYLLLMCHYSQLDTKQAKNHTDQ